MEIEMEMVKKFHNGDAAEHNLRRLLLLGASLLFAGCLMLATSVISLMYFSG